MWERCWKTVSPQAGITTAERIRALGAEQAFMKIRAQDPTACINMLCGIQGAVEGASDKSLHESTKARLRQFYRGLSTGG